MMMGSFVSVFLGWVERERGKKREKLIIVSTRKAQVEREE